MCVFRQKMEATTYYTDEGLAECLSKNVKEDGWTKSPICQSVLYKEAQSESGDLAQILNSKGTGNKKMFHTLFVDNNECIAANTVEFVAAVTYVLPDGSEDWIMTEDGTVPSGTPASFKVLKPKSAFAYPGSITKNGVRPGRFCCHSQFRNVTAQLADSSQIIDSYLDSNNKNTTTYMQNVIIDHFVNRPAVMDDGDVLSVNDFRLSLPDSMGSFAYTKEQLESTSPVIEARRIKRGDQPFLSFEKVHHKVLNGGDDIQLFSSLKDRVRKARVFPPGMSIKLSFDVADGSSRLVTGLVCQINTAASGQAATWEDVELTLKFKTCYIRYQAIELSQESLTQFRTGTVLGAEYAIDTKILSAKDTFAKAPCAKYVVSDLYQSFMSLSPGSTGATFNVNSGDREKLPQYMLIYLTTNDNSAFTTQALHTSNWDCLSFAETDIVKFQASTSGGQTDKAKFLDMYSNNDVDIRDPSELTIMGLNTSGQMFFRQATQLSSSVHAQQLVTAVPTWLNNGYTPDKMAARNCVAWYTDPSTSVVKDAANGLEKSQLTVQLTFGKALTSAKTLVVAQFLRSDIIFDIQMRMAVSDKVDASKPGYEVNKLTSGAAMRPIQYTIKSKDPIFIT